MRAMLRGWGWGVALGAWLLLGGLARAEGLWEVYLQARENDPQYKAAQAALEAARQAHPKALAAVLPSIWAAGSSGLNRFEDKHPVMDPKTGTPTSGHHYDTVKYGLYLSQPLVNLQAWAGLPQAAQREQEAEAVFQAGRAEMMVRFLDRYLRVLGAREKLHWVRAEKLAIGQGLSRARRAQELGLVSPLAEQRAQAALDLSEADEIAAEHQVANGLDGLRELTGRPHDKLARLRANLEVAPPEPNEPAHWQRLAQERNPNVLAKGYALEAARLEVWRQGSGHVPTLNLTGGHYYEDTGGGRVPGEDVMTMVALELRVPIFEGGVTLAQTREARAQAEKARQEEEAQRRLGARQAAEAFRGVNEGMRRIKALAQALRSSRAAVEAAQREMEVGSSSMVEFLEALRDLYRARRDYTDARHDYLLQRARLLQAAGQLEEREMLSLSNQFQEEDLPQLLVSLPEPAPKAKTGAPKRAAPAAQSGRGM